MVSMKQGHFVPTQQIIQNLTYLLLFWILFLKTPATGWLKIIAIVSEAITLSFYTHTHTKDVQRLQSGRSSKKKELWYYPAVSLWNRNIKQENWKHISHKNSYMNADRSIIRNSQKVEITQTYIIQRRDNSKVHPYNGILLSH